MLAAPLAVTAVVLAAAWGAGRAALRALAGGRLEVGSLEGDVALGTTLGIALLAQGAQVLALAGLLNAAGIVALLAAAYLLGRREFEVARAARVVRDISGPAKLVLAAGALPLLVLALYPPTGFDETAYHLPFIRGIAERGGFVVQLDLLFPVFPQLDEVLGAVVYRGGGDTAPHLIHLAETALIALLVVAWGRRRLSRNAGILAAGIFLGSPLVTHLATSGYIEVPVALYATAALFAADAARDSDAPLWPVLAGLFGGCAASAKYTGLFFLVAAGLLVLGGSSAGRRIRAVGLFAAAACAAGAVTYGRLVALTGNPVFPFATGLFGPNAWSLEDMVGPQTLGDRLRFVATVPWNLTFSQGLYARQPPVSPLFLAGLPFALVGAWRRRDVRIWFAVSLAFAIALSSLPLDPRYFVLAFPVAALAIATPVLALAGPRFASEDRLRKAVAVAAIAAFLPGWLYAFYRMARQGPLPVNSKAREAYLVRRLPGYAAVSHLNATLGARYALYACRGEELAYFARGRFFGQWGGPARYDRVLRDVRRHDAEKLERRLVALGADHLLLVDGGCNVSPIDRPAIAGRLPSAYRDARAEVFRLPRPAAP